MGDGYEVNWAGNYRYGASAFARPDSAEQVQELLASGGGKVKALGSRHSFNGIADTGGLQLSSERLNRILELDPARGRVTIEGGVRYGELGQYLDERGWALPNLASLPHISVAGACATATHGSGVRNRSLSASVRAMEVATANGELVRWSRDDGGDEFGLAVVHLGALGIVTKLTLDLVPAFRVRQAVYEKLPLAALETDLDRILSAAYSVSLFTDWHESAFNQVWLKQKEGESGGHDLERPAFFGAVRATQKVHPVPGQAADACSEQLGVAGPWHERLPHFRLDFTPSAGEELQSEYFVPRRHAYEALLAVNELRERIAPLLYVSEVRTVAADDLALSPCCGRDSIGIHFTWRPEWAAVRQVLPLIEAALEPFEARPHWAKLFAMDPARLQSLYERLPAFRRLALRHDPEGRFGNDFLSRYVLGAGQ